MGLAVRLGISIGTNLVPPALSIIPVGIQAIRACGLTSKRERPEAGTRTAGGVSHRTNGNNIAKRPEADTKSQCDALRASGWAHAFRWLTPPAKVVSASGLKSILSRQQSLIARIPIGIKPAQAVIPHNPKFLTVQASAIPLIPEYLMSSKHLLVIPREQIRCQQNATIHDSHVCTTKGLLP